MLAKGRSILGHMLAFGQETVLDALQARIQTAAALRRTWFDPARTNAIRLINAEGDGIPGLIVDAYNDTLVLQVANPGIEKLKSQIVAYLIDTWKPRAIYEKSTSFLRRKEGLQEIKAHLYGDDQPEMEVKENGLRYLVHVLEGQKTGLFLDQREMRTLVRDMSRDKNVLNCFAYTGGFTISALAGGASHVDSVEISAKCEERIAKNLALNQLSNHQFICADVFDYLKTANWDYDLVILDPPAFVKKRDDVSKAFRAYKELNRFTIEKMKPNSLLLTCSCSYHIEEPLFQNILFRAALEAGRRVQILAKHRQAHDHPISIFHPESAYLKSFLLHIS